MSSESVNPWEEANEEAKEEAKEETQEESVDIAANDSTVGESALVTQKPLSTESPMTTFEEARRASDLRNAEAVLKDLENRYAQLRGEKEQVQTFFESIQIQLEDALQENKKMRETLQGKEKEADESQRESRFLKEKCTTLELDCQAKDERLNRLTREADDLREEVSRLTESSKTAKSAMADLESQAKLFSADSIPYQYEVQRLKTDLDEMSAHAKWLDAELVSRNDQIVTLTKDFSSKVYGLRTELDEMTMQKETYCNDFKDLQRRYKASESKVEKLASENLRLKQEASDANSEAEQNLNAERRVVQLQKEQLELLQKRHDDVIRQMESMQAMALEAGKETQEELEIARSELEEAAKRILDEQANNHRAQIKELEAKLQEANRLRHEAEDCLIVSPAKASRRTLAAITAGGEETHGDEEEELPLNLTDAYTLLRKTEQELREERKNHKLAQLRLRRIEEDVKAKMPHYIRQRQEYETAVARDHESRQRLKQALADVASYRTEAQEARRDVFRLQKQNRELEKETTELAKQVQALLASRAGGDAAKGIPTSVEEIQQQNQQLLRENNRLTDEIQVLKSDPLRSNLEAAEKEIEAMKEERQRSELYVASIVQQRDLLRAQLHLDSKVLESELEQASTLAFAAQHLERIKELEAKNKQLEDDVGMSQAEAIRLRGEKDAAADRLLQYEAQVTTLSETVDSYLAQVASAKAEIARTEAEATYHREKCQRLEESLKRSAAEVARAAGAKSALENQNAKQQQALTEADAISSRLKQDLSQVERKLRLAETQVESAKSAEARATQEADRLRAEMARHGSLLETVHRIEASLTAKAEEESKQFEEEITRLREKLTAEKSQHAIQIDNLNGKLHELETELKNLAKRKDEAMTELIHANERAELSKSEVVTLTAKCDRLESQLRSAKKRLGETDGNEEDIEATLQAKIDVISSELEATSAELIAAKESVATYQKIAKESENALKELTKATDAFKTSQEAEMGELQRHLAAAKEESAARHDAVIELTQDLSGLREEHGKEVAQLKKQISLMESELEQLRKDADGASALVENLKVDVERLRGEASEAQDNYDRELALHSAARIDLSKARRELESALNATKAIDSQVQGLQTELLEKEKAWANEKHSLEEHEKELKTHIAGLREQNDLLHSQLDKLGGLVEKSQEERIFAATATGKGEDATAESGSDEVRALQKSASELRELIRFLRSEKEMLQVQLDTARRSADRERAAAVVARRSLDEARNELSVLQSNEAESTARPSNAHPSDQVERLRAIEDQVQLLNDSNKLLREQSDKLEKLLAASELELSKAKKSLEPYEQKQHILEVEKAGLEAEKASLLRENEAWKGRLQSLVSKFNQIDPVEHENVLKQVESLKKDIEMLRAQKKVTEEEAQRIKAMAAKVNKDLSQQKSLLESQKKTIARLTAEKESLATTSKNTTLPAKEREQFKEKIKLFEEENASVKTELAGAHERNDNLRVKLRQFQQVIATQKQTEKSLIAKFAVLEEELSQMKAERSTNEADTSKGSAISSLETQQTEDAGKSKAADDANSAAQQMQVAAAIEPVAGSLKQMDNQLPIIPPGGFNFGPDRPSTAVSSEKVVQSAPSEGAQDALPASDGKEDSTATAMEIAPLSSGSVNREAQTSTRTEAFHSEPTIKKRPPQSLLRDEGKQSSESDGEKKVVIDVPNEGLPSSTDDTQEEKLDDVIKTGKEQRRPSGEKKEQSLKEKLLMQKKRRLQVELAQKKAMLSAKTIQAEELAVKKRALSDSMGDSDVAAEPSSKRTKPEEGKGEAESVPSGGVAATSEIEAEAASALTSLLEQDVPKGIDAEEEDTKANDAEKMETEVRPEEAEGIITKISEEQAKTSMYEIDAKPAEETSDPLVSTNTLSVVNPFAVAVAKTMGETPLVPDKIVFGKASPELKFGGKSSEVAENPSLGTFPGSSTPPPFGKSASIVLPTATATGFGVSNEFSGVAYGSGAFLDTLKPPGTIPVPTFSFGKNGPITLPTPTINISAASPFDAFPASEPGQSSGARTQQLFGQPVGAIEVETTSIPDDNFRAGASEDSVNQDTSMGDTEEDDSTLII